MHETVEYVFGFVMCLVLIVLCLMAIDALLMISSDLITEHRRRTKLWKDIQELYWEIRRDRIDL